MSIQLAKENEGSIESPKYRGEQQSNKKPFFYRRWPFYLMILLVLLVGAAIILWVVNNSKYTTIYKDNQVTVQFKGQASSRQFSLYFNAKDSKPLYVSITDLTIDGRKANVTNAHLSNPVSEVISQHKDDIEGKKLKPEILQTLEVQKQLGLYVVKPNAEKYMKGNPLKVKYEAEDNKQAPKEIVFQLTIYNEKGAIDRYAFGLLEGQALKNLKPASSRLITLIKKE